MSAQRYDGQFEAGFINLVADVMQTHGLNFCEHGISKENFCRACNQIALDRWYDFEGHDPRGY